jgi:membrane fusion protein (multidrug efflux system)
VLKDTGKVALRPVAAETPTSKSESPQARLDAPAQRRTAPDETPSDTPAERPAAPKKTPQSQARRRARWALFALLPLALIAGGYWYVAGGQAMSMDDAYVEADKVGLSTDVSGIVSQVDVTENQHVEAGRVLYRLDDLPFRLALQRAEAQLGMVRNALDALKANYRDMQAQIKLGQNDVEYFGTESGRQQNLLSVHIASQSTYDTARRNLQNAQQKLASLHQQLAAVAANLNGDPDDPVEQNPRYLDALARQIAHTVVKAPFAGIVTNVPSIAPGKYLQASTTAFYLVATDHVWVDANPKETELTNVRAGQLAVLPLLVVFKKPSGGGGPDHTIVVE